MRLQIFPVEAAIFRCLDVSPRPYHAASPPDDVDWIALQASADRAALIHALLLGRSEFCAMRPGASRGDQVLAANIDTAVLMVGLDNNSSPPRVERHLAATWEAVPHL